MDWVGGDYFGPNCGGHLYAWANGMRHDIHVQAEKEVVATGKYRVIHYHDHDTPCMFYSKDENDTCQVVYGPTSLLDEIPTVEFVELETEYDAPRAKSHHPAATLPQRAYQDDVGYDLAYTGQDGDLTILPGECVDVPCGVSIQWPEGVWGFLVGRSSSFRNRGILVNPAIIDPGFRGELFAICRNIGLREVTVRAGERVAQVVPLPALAPGFPVFEEVDELDPTDRGSNGFGSSGV